MSQTPTHTTEQRLSHLEAEMLYTNTRVMSVLTDIKTAVHKIEERLDNLEQRFEKLQP